MPAAAETTLRLMEKLPWPKVAEGHRWAIELMEERLEKTDRSPEELRARAAELRAEAEETDITGYRDAALVLANRYENAAAAREAPTPSP
jgi:hypothetical protein